MTQFKAKAGESDTASAGLFTYPVLQAADVLLYRAAAVPVGEDQRQHLELARDLAARFNRSYAELFPLPAAILPDAARVMDLQRPTRKMSTSGGTERGTLFLLDSPEAIARKVRAAVTDPGREIRAGPERPGLSNLLGLLSAATGRPVPALEERFRGRGYAALKTELAEALVTLTMPIRARFRELEAAGFAGVEEILAAGAEVAGRLADETLRQAKAAVGLLPPRARRPDRVAPTLEWRRTR
jgi:tryptophanyl-tRNA synthetase